MSIHHDECRGAVDATPERVYAYLDAHAHLAPGELVTQREAPYRLAWETLRGPRVPVLASYGVGFEITPGNGRSHTRSHVRVYIDYVLPERGAAGWLARHFGRAYARRLVDRLLTDAIGHFAAERAAPVALAPRHALG